jgi:C1A family cysteine protease
MNYSFGCEPDTHDERDFRLKSVANKVFPDSVDLSEDIKTGWWFGEAHDQGSLGACTAFATNDMVRYVRFKTKLSFWPTSQLFTYYATRKLRGSIDEDSGATAREALKATADYGVAKYHIWPYDISKFKEEPPKEVWDNASMHQSLSYFRLEQTLDDLIGCLADGYPFTFGMKIYQSFIDFQKADFFELIIPKPDKTKEKYLGGHCMLAVGYFKRNEDYIIIVRNSWGKNFANQGYFYMPLEMMLDPFTCFDFWTLRTSENEVQKPAEPAPVSPKTFVEPPLPVEQTEPFWKNKNFYFLIGFGVLLAFFLLLR